MPGGWVALTGQSASWRCSVSLTCPDELDSDKTIRSVLRGAEAVAELAVLAVPSTRDDDDSEEPVLAARGVLRVASRFTGEETWSVRTG